MNHRILPLITLFLLLGLWSPWARAQSIPPAIPYTGFVAVDGVPLNSEGRFKFAIVDQSGTTTYWSNSLLGTDGAPINEVVIPVSNGLYALELGNTDLANMQEIPANVFDNPTTFLRVWFSDGVNGFQRLSPDRQLVSVPYAYRADGVSGTGTVVKSIVPQSQQGSLGSPVRDEVILVGGGNVVVQPRAGTANTIEIVGSTGNASAVALNCATPCVEPAEISGTLTDAHIPDIGTLSGVLVDGQIPSTIARDGDVTTEVGNEIADHVRALNAHNFTSISGALSDAQIPNTIARVGEVVCTTPCISPAEISGPLTDTLIPDLGQLSGAVTDAQIPDGITRDTEAARDVACAAPCVSSAEISGPLTDALIPDLGGLSGVLIDAQIPNTIARAGQAATDVACATQCVSSAEISGPLTDALIPDLGGLSGVLIDAQIPSTIARTGQAATDVACAAPCVSSAEISGPLTDALVGPVVRSITPSGGTPLTNAVVLAGAGTVALQQSGNTITIVGTTGGAAATDVACATPCVSPGEISGVLTEPQIDPMIARVAQLPTWSTLAGTPADFADGVDDVGILIETDPQIGVINNNIVPRWSNASTTLVGGQIYDDGVAVGIGTTSPATRLDVNGTVTVVALAASYVRVNTDESAAGLSLSTFSATCPNGTNVLGGGVNPQNATTLTMVGSWPNANNSWSVTVNNSDLGSVSVTVYAVCAAIQ